jgi:hypothetical protein
MGKHKDIASHNHHTGDMLIDNSCRSCHIELVGKFHLHSEQSWLFLLKGTLGLSDLGPCKGSPLDLWVGHRNRQGIGTDQVDSEE